MNMKNCIIILLFFMVSCKHAGYDNIKQEYRLDKSGVESLVTTVYNSNGEAIYVRWNDDNPRSCKTQNSDMADLHEWDVSGRANDGAPNKENLHELTESNIEGTPKDRWDYDSDNPFENDNY